ncbi:MAG: hypothetical protein GQ564_10275 [Bacteroidales bacterium]|nr:hypothetical protein [Bacteroidales bacterium]
MNKLFKINKISEPKGDLITPLTIDNYLDSIKENRDRVRLHSTQLSSICSLLLSAIFIVIFFLIKENYCGVLIRIIYVTMFSSVFFLIITLLFTILSTSLVKPTAISNVGEKLNLQIKIYNSEYKKMKIGQLTLIISIGLFSSGLLLFLILVSM